MLNVENDTALLLIKFNMLRTISRVYVNKC